MSETIQVKVNVDQIGPTASQGKAREHTVVMDRPEAKGGQNQENDLPADGDAASGRTACGPCV